MLQTEQTPKPRIIIVGDAVSSDLYRQVEAIVEHELARSPDSTHTRVSRYAQRELRRQGVPPLWRQEDHLGALSSITDSGKHLRLTRWLRRRCYKKKIYRIHIPTFYAPPGDTTPEYLKAIIVNAARVSANLRSVVRTLSIPHAHHYVNSLFVDESKSIEPLIAEAAMVSNLHKFEAIARRAVLELDLPGRRTIDFRKAKIVLEKISQSLANCPK